MASDNWDDWRQAIFTEIDNLYENGVIIVIDFADQKLVDAKWVLKEKENELGEIVRRKGRVVARGYTQEFGINYWDTYAATTKAPSWRILIALSVLFSWHIGQYDAVTAFLKSELKEDIYMKIFPLFEEWAQANPEKAKELGFVSGDSGRKVIKLAKTLYGLKQSAFEWQQLVIRKLGEVGFKALLTDDAVFRRPDGVIIATHVDDFLVFAPTRELLEVTGKQIESMIEVKRADKVSNMLGVRLELETNADGSARKIKISLPAYEQRICDEIGEHLKPMATPMAETDDDREDGPVTNVRLYQKRIGELLYAVGKTRPDIAFATGKLSRRSVSCDEVDHAMVKRVYRYLSNTIGQGIIYEKSDVNNKGLPHLVEGWCDASYGGKKTGDGKSVSGWIFYIAGGAVSWSSKKQAVVAQSSCEAELIAMNSAVREAAWIRGFILETLNGHKPVAVVINGDNQGALALGKNPGFHQRTKHLNVRYQYVRQQVRRGEVTFNWIPTSNMVADCLTKPLGKLKFSKSLKQLRLE